jgi:hypothetical protein
MGFSKLKLLKLFCGIYKYFVGYPLLRWLATDCWLLYVCFVGAMWLIVFLLYFPAIDANNSGEEEEVESDEDFIYIVGILILMELMKYRDK